jgi:hypothetical protein
MPTRAPQPKDKAGPTQFQQPEDEELSQRKELPKNPSEAPDEKKGGYEVRRSNLRMTPR